MKDFKPYLQKVGIRSEPLSKRVDFILATFREMCPEEIEAIFVAEYIKSDEIREHESLWCFSARYCLEAKQFKNMYDLDVMNIDRRIAYWTITMQDYNFKKAAMKSRLTLRFHLVQPQMGGTLKATRGNCDVLKDIIMKYVKPNMVE